MSHNTNSNYNHNSATGSSESSGNGGNSGGLYGLSYSVQYAASSATGAESGTGIPVGVTNATTAVGGPISNTAAPTSESATPASSTGTYVSDTTGTDRVESPGLSPSNTGTGTISIGLSDICDQKHISNSSTGSNSSSNSSSNNSSGKNNNNFSSSNNSKSITDTGRNINVMPKTMLTAKPHAFAGAVLSPKHTLELTPTLCMQISSALADHHKSVVRCVPYTVWITEAWRVLGWAEPSAALFWEMATMYHALAAAGRELAHHAGLMIPPILSCGSTSSLGSGATNSHTTDQQQQRNALDKKKVSSVASAKELPVWLVGTFLLLHCEEFAYLRNMSGQDERHERRFYAGKMNTGNTHGTTAGSASPAASVVMDSTTNAGGKLLPIVDFPGFFKNPSLSPRTRMHATWSNDNTHCTAFLLRHLRKFLLLSAVSHNHEATVACLHLGSMPSPTEPPSLPPTLNFAATHRLRPNAGTSSKKYDANELRRHHADEHGSVGAQVRLTMEDLERLDFVLQPPHGGGIDEPPVRLGEFLWRCLYHGPPPPTASIPLLEVEREIRQHLELELAVVAGMENPNDDTTGAAADKYDVADGRGGPCREALSDSQKEINSGSVNDSGISADRAKADACNHYKERRYNRIQGTTVILKPVPPESPSTASVASGEVNFINGIALGRLHDVVLSDCSDAHFYLLQPFEHATIAACSGCTIVVGAVAGLLHVVDCEKLIITTASRRIMVSNSSDVQLCTFTPSPPLLVGDNRSCLFAPYNTFYDGMREDLLATGLAAAVISDGHHSPYHVNRNDNDISWPLLQCASNKWKNPIEVAKLEVPTVPGSPGGINSSTSSLSPGADDRAMGTNAVDVTMLVSTLVSPTDFQVLFVPIETDASRQRKLEAEDADVSAGEAPTSGSMASQYCQLLAEVLQLSPFRLPLEYERRALLKAERMKNIQQSVQKNLSLDQQRRFEEELNRGFRDWLVTSGNLRQVLDLVHLEVK